MQSHSHKSQWANFHQFPCQQDPAPPLRHSVPVSSQHLTSLDISWKKKFLCLHKKVDIFIFTYIYIHTCIPTLCTLCIQSHIHIPGTKGQDEEPATSPSPLAEALCRFLIHSGMEIPNSWNHVTLWQEFLHFCLFYIRTERSHKENERFPALRWCIKYTSHT